MELRDGWSWALLRSFLPEDLESLARRTGLVSRLRGTDTAEDLTRLLLMCALPKATLAQASAWGREAGISRMNAAALFFRLRAAGPYLEALLEHALARAAAAPGPRPGGGRLLAADGTVLCGPGSRGVDLRVHALYGLGPAAPVRLEATDARGGEGLARFAADLRPGDLVLADRGYSRTRGLAAALGAGASVLVRFEFSHLRLLDAADGVRIPPARAGALLGPGDAPAELAVRLDAPGPVLRAIGRRGPDGKPFWLLTDLSAAELSAGEARALYARRWQVELFFKRLKSLLDLDELPSPRQGPTARPWALAKLLLAVLAVLAGGGPFSPWEGGPDDVPPDGGPGLPLEAVPPGGLGRDGGPPGPQAPAEDPGRGPRRRPPPRTKAPLPT